jgi:molecular chaperone GrpE
MSAEETNIAATDAGAESADPPPITEVEEPLQPEGEPPAEAGLAEPEPEAAAGDAAAEAQAKADEYLALAQRTQADFENYRKRATRDAAAAVDRGVEKLARELLPALDHLELALQAAESHDAGEWVKGIRGIQDELLGALNRVGIQPFSPQGEPFDPNEHEAMAQQPSDEVEAGNVLQVYQQGYRLNGQVLRPARVVVAGGAAA